MGEMRTDRHLVKSAADDVRHSRTIVCRTTVPPFLRCAARSPSSHSHNQGSLGSDLNMAVRVAGVLTGKQMPDRPTDRMSALHLIATRMRTSRKVRVGPLGDIGSWLYNALLAGSLNDRVFR